MIAEKQKFVGLLRGHKLPCEQKIVLESAFADWEFTWLLRFWPKSEAEHLAQKRKVAGMCITLIDGLSATDRRIIAAPLQEGHIYMNFAPYDQLRLLRPNWMFEPVTPEVAKEVERSLALLWNSEIARVHGIRSDATTPIGAKSHFVAELRALNGVPL